MGQVRSDLVERAGYRVRIGIQVIVACHADIRDQVFATWSLSTYRWDHRNARSRSKPVSSPFSTVTKRLSPRRDAAILPGIYQKTVLYRPPNLTNVYVQAYYGMYNYAVLGVSS